MNKQLSLSGVAALAAAALVLTGCSGASTDDSTSGDAGMTTVKVGNLVYTGTAPFEVGIEQGFFEDEGLTIEQTEADNPAAIAAQLQSGQLDIGFSTVSFLLTAASEGADLKAIASVEGLLDPDDPITGIVVAADSDIASPKDLEGKNVGVVALGSLLDLEMRAVVDADGGDSSKVQAVQLPFPQMQQALEAGSVDAIVTTEPFFSATVAGGSKTISTPDVDVFPLGSTTAWIATGTYIDENPETVAKFARAVKKSLEYAAENPDEILDFIPGYTGLDPAQLESMALGTVYDPELKMETFELMADLLVKYEFITSRPDVASLIHESD